MMSPQDEIEIQTYLNHLRLSGHPDTTINTYRTPLYRVARELPRGLLSPSEVIAGWLAGVKVRNTRASYDNSLRCFYRWAIRTGRYLGQHPMNDLPATQRQRGLPRPVSTDELARILSSARDPYRLWCLLMACAGLRSCEVARLDRGDVTEDMIYIRGKGEKLRVVPTHPQVWEVVRGLPPGPIADCTPKRVSANVSRECQKRLGLVGVTGHRLRHWAGTGWQNATGDVRVTQELLGHASPTTTAVYTQVSNQAMRAAVLGLPPLNGASGASRDRQDPPAAGRP